MKRRKKGIWDWKPRRKWEKRGENLVDFLFGCLITICYYMLYALYLVVRGVVLGIIWIASKVPARERAAESIGPGRGKEIVGDKGDSAGKGRQDSGPGDRKEEKESYAVAKRPKVRFSDIAGLEAPKREVRQQIIEPVLHPERAERFGIKAGGGLLLYGPPGTGKTMLAKAVANEIDAPFFSVRPSNVISSWVGNAERKIEKLFSQARAAAGKHERAVIFIDEIEALAPSRDKTPSTVMQRVVSQMLGETDGVESDQNTGILIIGATNVPWMVDEAMLRPGRLGVQIFVGLPSQEARKKILENALGKLPVQEGLMERLDELSYKLEGYSGADTAALVKKASKIAFDDTLDSPDEEEVLTMEHLESAMEDIRPSVSEKQQERFRRFERNRKSA